MAEGGVTEKTLALPRPCMRAQPESRLGAPSWDTGPGHQATVGGAGREGRGGGAVQPPGQSAPSSSFLRGVGRRWGATLRRVAISTKCQEVCLPASGLCVQSSELFIRPSRAQHRRGRQEPRGTARLHLSLSRPQHQTTTVTSLEPPPPPPPPHTHTHTQRWSPSSREDAQNRCAWRPSPEACRSPQPPPTKPPTTPLTGWGWCAIAADWKLVLESGQGAWRRKSTQHWREEEGVGGHRVPIEVPSPRCWAGAAVAGHAKQPQSEG